MSVWTDFTHWLSNVGHAILGFMGDLMTSIAENGGAVLIQAATDAVAAAETKGGTGAEKLAAAQAAVIADLTNKGIPVVLNAVNGAIEAAVARLKATANAA